jgi:hypothetical protein
MEVGSQAKLVGHFSPDLLSSLIEDSTPAWCGAPLELTEGTKSGAQRACIRPRCIEATRLQTNLHLHLHRHDVFVFCMGPAVSHRMYCSLPRLIVLTPALVSPSSPHQTTWDASISERRNYGREMSDQIKPTIATSTVIVGFFYMPKSCDMGQTALLPLRRKVCWGFFRPKNPTVSAGFEPVNLGTRSKQANH